VYLGQAWRAPPSWSGRCGYAVPALSSWWCHGTPVDETSLKGKVSFSEAFCLTHLPYCSLQSDEWRAQCEQIMRVWAPVFCPVSHALISQMRLLTPNYYFVAGCLD
jgi:hypothetical protein